MASKKGLGKGLGALLEDFSEEPVESGGYKLLPLHRVVPNPDQPRQDFDEEELEALAESIRIHGVLQPLTVRETASGYYQIIAGERRWRASRLAKERHPLPLLRRVEQGLHRQRRQGGHLQPTIGK